MSQSGNQLVCRLGSFFKSGPGCIAAVQRRQRLDVNDFDVPRSARQMAQLGHVIPAICYPRDEFLNRLWLFLFHWTSF
ncbi:hypothetical protein BH10PSE16_BH10PSE16_01390 [soil metagenome]